MKNFTLPQLIKSLVMPLLTLGYGAVALVGEAFAGAEAFTGFSAVRAILTPLVMIVLGGLVPVLLTILKNIHTERYFLKRLCMWGVCFALVFLGGQLTFGIVSTLLFVAIFGGDIVYELVKVMDEDTTKGERAVILLSDFFIWFCVDYILMAFRELGTMTLL